MTRQALSAKSFGRQLVEFEKSFINNKNNNGPRNDPCATPYVIGSTLDLLSLIKVYCFRFKKDFFKDIDGAANALML